MSGTTPPRGGSRNPTPRPRRVAGQGRVRETPVGPAAPVDEPVVEEPLVEEPLVEEPVSLEKSPAAEPEAQPATTTPGTRRRRTVMAVVLVVLLVVGVVEVLLLQGDGSDATPSTSTAPSAPSTAGASPSDGATTPGADPALSDPDPIQVSQDEWLAVVAQSATAATTILSASATDGASYDAEVDTAAALMTDPFAEEFRTTKADVKPDFLAKRTEVTVEVSWQGVVSATPDEIRTLLFLTQSTTKAGTDLTAVQYRVTVTMLNTPDGWLVGGLDAS